MIRLGALAAFGPPRQVARILVIPGEQQRGYACPVLPIASRACAFHNAISIFVLPLFTLFFTQVFAL